MTNALQSPPVSAAARMRFWTRLVCLPLVVGLWMGGPWMGSSAYALTPEVKDNAGLFTPAAIEKANREIAEIERKFRKDLLIETFATVPKDKVESVKEMDAHGRAQFFHAWALERARKNEVNGAYVLVTKVPLHIKALVGKETELRAFTLRQSDHLVDEMGAAFKRGDFDGGLLQGVSYVQKTMAENLGVKPRPSGIIGAPPAHGDLNRNAPLDRNAPLGGGRGMSWVGLIILAAVVLFGVWIVLAILRGIAHAFGGGGGMSRGGMPGPGGMGMPGPGGGGYGYGGGYGPGGGGGGGGGFMSGMLGGLFGAAAGNWLYDSFRGGGGSHLFDGTHSSATTPVDDSTNAVDQDYADSGHDFDDSSQGGGGGGGDFDGGGDYDGGGDSGGGDFGGGGDFDGGGDFGGGGGDF